jgi:hypothetical protein
MRDPLRRKVLRREELQDFRITLHATEREPAQLPPSVPDQATLTRDRRAPNTTTQQRFQNCGPGCWVYAGLAAPISSSYRRVNHWTARRSRW